MVAVRKRDFFKLGFRDDDVRGASDWQAGTYLHMEIKTQIVHLTHMFRVFLLRMLV
jgi:hypothetical protein